MKQSLHSDGRRQQVEELKSMEREELKDITTGRPIIRLYEVIKIRIKYARLKGELKQNNYGQNQLISS